MMLQERTALVTGAGRGIGRAIAIAFAEQGCDLALAARSKGEVAETARMVRALGRHAIEVQCDVSCPEDVARMVNIALEGLGLIDILVNNAGYACFKPFVELTLEEWRRTLDVNLTGAFLCTQAVLPSMMARREGRIINVSSVSGLKPIAEQSAYCASKHGLNGLTTTLALELRAHGIAVHAICPGGVDTQFSRDAMPHRDKSGWLLPEDVAHAALYLASLSPRAATDIIHVRRFDSPPLGG